MAVTIREVLNADQMPLSIFCGGASKVGIGITGTWAGTAFFFAATDGVNFSPVTVTPFPSGTPVSSATANGNFELLAANYTAVKAVFSRTSGSAVIVMSASADSSYQDAYLAAATKYPNSAASGATNTLTVAAQANRAWRLRTLTVSVDTAPTWAASPNLVVKDGTAVLWGLDLPAAAGVYAVPLPADTGANPGGGLVNTPGNAMSVVVASGGGAVKTNINAELVAA